MIKRIKSVLFLVIILFLIDAGNALSQTPGKLNFRTYNPVMLPAASIAELQGSAVDLIRLYSYNIDLDQWLSVPFQIDEKDGGWSYFKACNGILDGNDEIVFMAADAGDKARSDQWPQAMLYQGAQRWAVELKDNLETETAWLYLYVSSTLPLSGESYISYDADLDQIDTEYYRAIHMDSGFQESLELKYADGSMSPDIMDRQKLRLKIRIDLGPLGSKTITLREEMDERVEILFGASIRITVKKIDVKAAPSQVLRLNRQLALDIHAHGSFVGYTMNFRDTLRFSTAYYPAYTEWRADDLNIPQISEGDVREMRLSFDLSSSASGMVMQNDNNANIRVDALPDEDFDHSLEWPGSNWYLMHANPDDADAVLDTASIVGIINVTGEPLGTEQNLYYKDIFFNANDSADRVSFGETGLQILGNDITGLLDFYGGTYFLPKNLDIEQARSLVIRHNTPVDVIYVQEEYVNLQWVTVDTQPSGLDVIIDGITVPTPVVFQWEESSTHQISLDSLIVPAQGERYKFSSWSHGLNASHLFTVDTTDTSLTASFDHEYYLATAIMPEGTGVVEPPPPGLWVVDGTDIQITATESGWHSFTGWQGSYNGLDNPVVLTVDSSITMTATFGNDAPAITMNDTTFAEDDTLIFTRSWILSQVEDDNPDSSLTIQLFTGRFLSVVEDTVLQQWAVTNTDEHWYGNDTLRVTVTDPLNETASVTISIAVYSINDAPDDFALLSPEDGLSVDTWPESFDFQWEEATDPDQPDSVLYVFQLDSSSSFDSVPLIQIGGLHRPAYTLYWPLSYGDGSYYWRILAVDRSGLQTVSTQVHSIELVTGVVTEDSSIPRSYALMPNYPNPFNGGTIIEYSLPEAAPVDLIVYNSQGQQVVVLHSALQVAGHYSVEWDGLDSNNRPVASGIYLLLMKAASYQKVQRMLLLR